MSHKWESASTQQGRERLKELMDGGCNIVIVKCYIPHDQRYEVSEWPIEDAINYVPAEGIEEPIEFLDPEPQQPKPLSIDEMREYCIKWCEGLSLNYDESKTFPHFTLKKMIGNDRIDFWLIEFSEEMGGFWFQIMGNSCGVDIVSSYSIIRAIERGEIGGEG